MVSPTLVATSPRWSSSSSSASEKSSRWQELSTVDAVDPRPGQSTCVEAVGVEAGRVGERRAETGLDRLLPLRLVDSTVLAVLTDDRVVEHRQRDQRGDRNEDEDHDECAALVGRAGDRLRAGWTGESDHRVTAWMHDTASLAWTRTLIPFQGDDSAFGMSTISNGRVSAPARHVQPAGWYDRRPA